MTIPRGTFLARIAAGFALLFIAGPQRLLAALHRPTLTEMIADGKWHRLTYWSLNHYGHGYAIAIDGLRVPWNDEELQWPEAQIAGGFEVWVEEPREQALPYDPPAVDMVNPAVPSCGPGCCGPYGFYVRRWK